MVRDFRASKITKTLPKFLLQFSFFRLKKERMLKSLFFIYIFSIGLSLIQFEFVGLILFLLIILSVLAWLVWEEWTQETLGFSKGLGVFEVFFPFLLISTLYVLVWFKLDIFWVIFILEFQSFIILGACYLFKKDNNWTIIKGVEGSINYIFPAFFSFILMLFYVILSSYNLQTTYQMNLIMNGILTLSILTKLGAFPVFIWVPRVFKNVCYNTLILLSVISKVFLISIILVYLPIKGPNLIIVGIISIMLSSFYMLSTPNIKKFLAFSSIANVGWSLILIVSTISGLPLDLTGSEVLCIFFFFYGFNLILLCVVMRKESDYHLFYLSNKLVTNQHFVILLCILTLTLLSLSGLPPFSGFFGKYIILLEYFDHSLLITLFLLLTSALFVFIYLRPVVYYLTIGVANILKESYRSNTSKGMYSNVISYLVLLNIHIVFCVFYIL